MSGWWVWHTILKIPIPVGCTSRFIVNNGYIGANQGGAAVHHGCPHLPQKARSGHNQSHSRVREAFVIKTEREMRSPPESRWGKRKAVEENGKPLRKAESRWGKRKAVKESGKPLRKAESHWGKRKAVEESGKPLRKAESCWRKWKAIEENWKAVEENRI